MRRVAATAAAYSAVVTRRLKQSAAQVAVGEEDGPRSAATHQGALFPEVGTVAGHRRRRAAAAESRFAGQASGAALVGAETAFGQSFLRQGRLALEAAIHGGLTICRLKRFQLSDLRFETCPLATAFRGS